MSEKLTIKNFGPIGDRGMALELRAINILIGDQSTGKSTVAKILMVVKEMIHVYGDCNNNTQESDWNSMHFQDQLEIHGLTSYLKPDSFIEFRDSVGYFKYDDQKIIIQPKDSKRNSEKNTYTGGFIPSYREAAVLLKDDLFLIIAKNKEINWPQLFSLFGHAFIVAKRRKKLHNYKDILGIEYKLVGDEYQVILNDETIIKLEEASSAINSGIPMLLVFDNAVESMYPTGNQINHRANRPYIIIEEPELNCFPTTQKKIMEHFISKIRPETKDGPDYYCGLLITTHSPYILTSLNNMMYAYSVGQRESVEAEANKIIPKKYWINPDDVSAYMLLTDGTCEDIVDREENLIEAEKIDDVTNTLNEQFSSLLGLQFSENELDTV